MSPQNSLLTSSEAGFLCTREDLVKMSREDLERNTLLFGSGLTPRYQVKSATDKELIEDILFTLEVAVCMECPL